MREEDRERGKEVEDRDGGVGRAEEDREVTEYREMNTLHPPPTNVTYDAMNPRQPDTISSPYNH